MLLEGSPERSTMEENITINTKNKKKLTKLSPPSSELVSSYMSQPHTVSLLATFASTTSSELVKRRNRGAFTTAWILLLTILNLVSSSSSSYGCEFSKTWEGKWFHHGFPEPLSIARD